MSPQTEEEPVKPLEEWLIRRKTPLRAQRILTGESFGSIPASNDRPTRDIHNFAGSDSSGWNHSNQGRSQPGGFGKWDVPEPQMTDTHNHEG